MNVVLTVWLAFWQVGDPKFSPGAAPLDPAIYMHRTAGRKGREI